MLSGSPFNGGPTNMSVITPKRLTIWLPKSVKVSGAPAKPCTQAFARTMNITTSKRCAKILAGRLGGNSDIYGWFAWAGPKQGAKQRLWLRGRSTGSDDDGALVGLGTGWIEPVKGATKLTLELGQLGIDTRGLEVYSGAERTTAGRVRPLTGKSSGRSGCAWTRRRAAPEVLPLLAGVFVVVSASFEVPQPRRHRRRASSTRCSGSTPQSRPPRATAAEHVPAQRVRTR